MPTRDTAWPAGTPCWIQYSAEDLPAAFEFYRRLLGWSFTEPDPAYGGYATALIAGRPVAGMMPRMSEGEPSAWMLYFAVDDAAAVTERIRVAGGTVVAGPHPVGELGVMTVAVDPTGMAFGVWQQQAHTGFGVFNEPGSVVWEEGFSADPQRAREFYTTVFGFRHDPVPGAGDYTTFAVDADPLGGLGAAGELAGWQICFAVTSTDDAVAEVRSAGGGVVEPPTDTPWGRLATVRDPWGATMRLMSASG